MIHRNLSEKILQSRSIAEFFVIACFFTIPFSFAAHNVCFAAAVLFGSITIFQENSIKFINKDPLSRVLIIFILLITIFSIFSLSTWSDALGVTFKKYLKISLGFILLWIFIKNEARAKSLKYFFFGSLIVLALTYINLLDMPTWFPGSNSTWGDQTVAGNYITQGIMMSFFVLLCLFYASQSNKAKNKIICYSLTALASISILYLSNGRTGYLTFLFGIFAYSLFSIPRKWLPLAITGIALVASIAFATSERLQHRYQLAKNETTLIFEQSRQEQTPHLTSIGARWYMWMQSVEIIKERPIIGWGLGSHGIKWCERTPTPEWCAVGDTTPHNQFLFFTTEMGIFGFGWFLLLLSTLTWSAWHGGKYRPLMMGFIAIFIADSLVNASLWNAREYNFFIIFMCLLYACARFGTPLIHQHDAKNQPA